MGSYEWSGELITREEGNITDLSDWKIIAEEIYLADIGTAGYTSYEVDKDGFKAVDIAEMYEKFPGLTEGTHKNHHIHSHHSMSAFFSGTDWEQLNDRALVSNYFLMLIVNFDGKYVAKLAFRAKKTGGRVTALELYNNIDAYPPITLRGESDPETLAVMDCKIVYPDDIEEDFRERYESVKDATKSYSSTYGNYGGYGGYAKGYAPGYGKEQTLFPVPAITPPTDAEEENEDWINSFNSWARNGWDYKNGVWVEKEVTQERKISDMTDKEWNKTQQPDKKKMEWEIRHVKMVINFHILNQSDPKDCIQELTKINKKMKNDLDRENWITEFGAELAANFDGIFPDADQDEYIEFLEKMLIYLRPYQHVKLIRGMYKEVQEEVELYKVNPIYD